ncbi:hypothetical protein K438DRAFT_1820696 [Mycena galopus ATCC 62051]|nr:hypothetical protein K438DRAFT_1820696 [Mycena galopus ATCC 62051]
MPVYGIGSGGMRLVRSIPALRRDFAASIPPSFSRGFGLLGFINPTEVMGRVSAQPPTLRYESNQTQNHSENRDSDAVPPPVDSWSDSGSRPESATELTVESTALTSPDVQLAEAACISSVLDEE